MGSRLGTPSGILATAYLCLVGLTLLVTLWMDAFSPEDPGSSGVNLFLLTLPWSVVGLTALDRLGLEANQGVFAYSFLALGGCLNATIIYALRWAPRLAQKQAPHGLDIHLGRVGPLALVTTGIVAWLPVVVFNLPLVEPWNHPWPRTVLLQVPLLAVLSVLVCRRTKLGLALAAVVAAFNGFFIVPSALLALLFGSMDTPSYHNVLPLTALAGAVTLMLFLGVTAFIAETREGPRIRFLAMAFAAASLYLVVLGIVFEAFL